MFLTARFSKKTIITFKQLLIFPISSYEVIIFHIAQIIFDFKSIFLVGNLAFSLFLALHIGLLQGLFSVVVFLSVFLCVEMTLLNVLFSLNLLAARLKINLNSFMFYTVMFTFFILSYLNLNEAFINLPILGWAARTISLTINNKWLFSFIVLIPVYLVIIINFFTSKRILRLAAF